MRENGSWGNQALREDSRQTLELFFKWQITKQTSFKYIKNSLILFVVCIFNLINSMDGDAIHTSF